MREKENRRNSENVLSGDFNIKISEILNLIEIEFVSCEMVLQSSSKRKLKNEQNNSLCALCHLRQQQQRRKRRRRNTKKELDRLSHSKRRRDDQFSRMHALSHLHHVVRLFHVFTRNVCNVLAFVPCYLVNLISCTHYHQIIIALIFFSHFTYEMIMDARKKNTFELKRTERTLDNGWRKGQSERSKLEERMREKSIDWK